jgi:GNAT superfamily N-acetyltransferase
VTRIRAATADDAEVLALLAGQLGYPSEARTIRQRLDDMAECRTGVVLVAVDEHDAVIGFAHALPQRFLIADPFVDLAGMVVAETARGQDVGTALLAAVEAWAREQGFASVRVRSNVVRERAHRFYLREGYAEQKRQVVFVKSLPAG